MAINLINFVAARFFTTRPGPWRGKGEPGPARWPE
jgi:hypothetical protein